MSKKGKKNQNATPVQPSAAEKLKDQGNHAFNNTNYQKAVDLYTAAIELEKNAIFYANRSAALFELERFKESLEDAESSIAVNKEYAKAYLRKALALRELDCIAEALQVAKQGNEYTKLEAFDKLIGDLETEYKEDNLLPQDNEEIAKIRELLDWLKKGGAIFPKLKVKYYAKNYRGVHSAQKIKVHHLYESIF